MLLDDIELFSETYDKIRRVMEAHDGDNIVISYSGGSDSDTIMWLMRHLGYKVPAVFFNTGIEYQATLDHIDYMREQGFEIEIVKPEHSVPYALKNHGKPFINKMVSSMISRLQAKDFDFIDDGNKSPEDLFEKYSKVNSGIKWFNNLYYGDAYKISWNKWLREFLLENPIPFKISSECCNTVKKKPAEEYSKTNNINLTILGMRRAEKGWRLSSIKSCYYKNQKGGTAIFMPIYYWKDGDKKLFDETFGIKHSRCYTEYGLARTGCAGCPFGRKFEEELEILEKYEPKLYKAVNHIFGDSYAFTRKYRSFVEEKNKEAGK